MCRRRVAKVALGCGVNTVDDVAFGGGTDSDGLTSSVGPVSVSNEQHESGLPVPQIMYGSASVTSAIVSRINVRPVSGTWALPPTSTSLLIPDASATSYTRRRRGSGSRTTVPLRTFAGRRRGILCSLDPHLPDNHSSMHVVGKGGGHSQKSTDVSDTASGSVGGAGDVGDSPAGIWAGGVRHPISLRPHLTQNFESTSAIRTTRNAYGVSCPTYPRPQLMHQSVSATAIRANTGY